MIFTEKVVVHPNMVPAIMDFVGPENEHFTARMESGLFGELKLPNSNMDDINRATVIDHKTTAIQILSIQRTTCTIDDGVEITFKFVDSEFGRGLQELYEQNQHAFIITPRGVKFSIELNPYPMKYQYVLITFDISEVIRFNGAVSDSIAKLLHEFVLPSLPKDWTLISSGGNK